MGIAPTGEHTTPRIKGGALGKGENFYLYDFLQAHFHWGSHSGQGSEHKINDVEYPMELHIVHTRTNFADDVASAVDPDNCILNGAYCVLSVVAVKTIQPWILLLTLLLKLVMKIPMPVNLKF